MRMRFSDVEAKERFMRHDMAVKAVCAVADNFNLDLGDCLTHDICPDYPCINGFNNEQLKEELAFYGWCLGACNNE